MRWWLLLVVLVACKGAPRRFGCELCDAHPDSVSVCNPLSQNGCTFGQKCTWVDDPARPDGAIRCVPDGSVAIGQPCSFGPAGPSGYDDCAKGGVCSDYGGSAVCRAVCDNQGGEPTCDATHACFIDPRLFSTGNTSPHAAGVCLESCDPLADNDFDGSGSALSRTGSACGSATIGCYGEPSGGTPPQTAFACIAELHYTAALRHRTECTTATGCANVDGTLSLNSCNQGYLPLSRESTANSTTICVAMCKPLDCYAGNCGSNNINRLGAAPHRCTTPDAVGNFGSGEECQYLWAREVNGNGQWQPSPYSDSLGFCFDHSQYQYDSDGNGTPDTTLPGCEDLPLHGSGSAIDAVLLGCVSSQTAGLGSGSAVSVYAP